MDNNFWKPFATLFGIGVAVAYAKKLRTKSKYTFKEMVSECIISGAISTGAALLYVYNPDVPFVAVMGLGAIAAALGVNFFSKHIEDATDRLKDKYLGKKENDQQH